MNNMRIGHGFDVHAFCSGTYIMLGGVKIPFNRALKAHSDGDVLIHSICDAILGALGLGDIGKHFPDTDEKFASINSRYLLEQVYSLLKSKQGKIVNIDSTVIAQEPKISAYIERMLQNISTDIHCPLEHINIKATTTEKLGYIGRIEGISAHSVVLIDLCQS